MAKYTIFSNIISGSSAFIPAITGSLQGSASYAATASVAPLYTLTSVTASMLQPYVLNSATSSFVQNSQTGSFVTNSQTSSMSVASASLAATASYAPSYVLNSFTSSFVLNSQTSSMSVASASAASNFFVGNSLTASNALINGTITAQTLIVQTVTSSVDFVTGSTRFGSLLTNTHQFTGSVSITGSLTVVGSISGNLTGSVLGTASWATNAITASFAPSYVLNSATSSFVLNSQTSSFVINSQTGSFAITGSNRFVGDQVITGSLILSSSAVVELTIIGNQTITGSLIVTQGVTGSLQGTSSWSQNAITASFAPSYVLNSATSSFVLNSQTSSFVQNSQTSSFVTNAQTSSFVINSQTGSFAITGSNRFVGDQTITGSLIISSSAVVDLIVIGNQTITGSLIATQGFTGSLLGTSSWSQNAISASFASTASSVNTLNQNVLITGSLAIGTSSIGPFENTLTLGARDTGAEGGQIGFNAPGGTYTSASFIDNWQNNIRILRGTNASSDATVATWNLHTKQMQLPQYTNASSFPGTATANLAVNSNGDVITVSTSGGSVFPYTGNAQINGGLGVTGSIAATTIFLATNTNGAAYLRGGDDVELWDINVSNHLGIYGQQDQTVASIKLGNNGGILSGRSGSIGIGTILPVSGTLHVNGNVFANSLTGSLFGTSSFATTASFAISASWAPSTGGGGLKTKAGSVANTSFTGNPDKVTVTFSTPFADTNYAVTVTGEDARSWTIESKAAGSFVINTNSNVALLGTTYWHAIAYGEA